MGRGTGKQLHLQICLSEVTSQKGPAERHGAADGHVIVAAPRNPPQTSAAYRTGLSGLFPWSIFLSLCQHTLHYQLHQFHKPSKCTIFFFKVISFFWIL